MLGPKASFRPHKLKVKLSGHMVRISLVIQKFPRFVQSLTEEIVHSSQDGVRALAFHPTEPIIVSGSEDCTVKVWNLSSVIAGPPSQRYEKCNL